MTIRAHGNIEPLPEVLGEQKHDVGDHDKCHPVTDEDGQRKHRSRPQTAQHIVQEHASGDEQGGVCIKQAGKNRIVRHVGRAAYSCVEHIDNIGIP